MAVAEGESVRDKVVELLNQAAFLPSEKERVATLGQVQELVVHREPELLDTFYEEIVAFQSDKNSDVRKWIVGFIEEACKKDPRMLPLLLANIQLLLEDSAVSVVKRCVQATIHLHRGTLVWIADGHTTSDDMELAWIILSRIKAKIVDMIDHDNDGVRTQVIKCLESIILVQSYTEPSSISRDKEPSFCLDNIPLTLKLARPRKLEDEAKTLLVKLISFEGSIHISSVNLMTCMSSLVIIARARPAFLPQVVQGMELLHANLPPTLSKSQVNSVRKHLKLQLLNLLKHQSAASFHDAIVAVLTDLGMSNSEINKAVPNREEMRRLAKKRERAKAASSKTDDKSEGSTRKRARLQSSSTAVSSTTNTTSSSSSKDNESSSKAYKKSISDTASANNSLKSIKQEELIEEAKRVEELLDTSEGGSLVDITTKWVVQRLTIDSVTELVMTSMLALPPTMPGVFSAGYTPVSGAGSHSQKHQVARLLASQLVAANVAPGCNQEPTVKEDLAAVQQRDAGDSDDESPLISFLGSRTSQFTVPPPVLPPPVLAPIRHKIQAVKLSEVTPQLSPEQHQQLQLTLATRLLRSSNGTHTGRVMLANMLTLASEEEVRTIESVLFSDLVSYSNLIQLWVFALHASTNDFSQLGRICNTNALSRRTKQHYQGYNCVLLRIVKTALPSCHDQDTREFLSNLLLSCPSVPLEVVSAIVEGVVGGAAEPGDGGAGAAADVQLIGVVAPLLRDLALWRSAVAMHTVSMLCSLATHRLDMVRESVLSEIEAILISGGALADTIVTSAKNQLQYLVEPQPPQHLFADYLGRRTEMKAWDEDTVKACLQLPLAILPLQQSLVHDLAQVYIKTVNEAKRGILRLLEGPVDLMGMDSPQLLALVHNTPKGSETLITRIIHILTEKAPPSEALVCQVRELYNRRVSDVRFLIPVLTGLSKKEVIAVLHKLIKLNPHVVKEVFNRLWGVTLDTGATPLSPAELLVALHLIEADKCDVKTVIKATGLCMQERSIYTAEVLGIVVQELLEEPVIPTLLMRTVIMALTHHPSLMSFIITVLVRLIEKEVWSYPKVWEGFVKCCERAIPQCCCVLLQLPLQHLRSALDISAVLKTALAKHVEELTESQRSHLPSDLLELLGVTYSPAPSPTDVTDTTPPIREIASPIEHAA